jgi:hypothetical protein
MESTNLRFYKSPSPEIYKKMKTERETLMKGSGDIKFHNTAAKYRRPEIDKVEMGKRDAKWALM